MHLTTHLLAGWAVATATPLDRRERFGVVLAGVGADLDAAGIGPELATRGALDWWSRYHHVLGHNLFAGLALSAAAASTSRRPLRVGLLALASFHLHLLGDLVGARGPDGWSWPIHYAWPLDDTAGLQWGGQWPMDSWPNVVITGVLLAWALGVAVRRGVTPVDLFSPRADRPVVAAIRGWFRRRPPP